MVYKVKEAVIGEFEKQFGAGAVHDVTFQRLLDFREKSVKGIKIVILELTLKIEKITMKLISDAKSASETKLYLNGQLIGNINKGIDIDNYIRLIINTIVSIK